MDVQKGHEIDDWREAVPADFAVIGDPVGHSLSPVMHHAAYEALGLPYRYVAVRVPRSEVAAAFAHFKALGYRGVNVTVPHKEEALAACALPDRFAQRVGAANTIRLSDMACINTDGPGFLDTVRELGIEPGARVLLLGAGGSTRSIACALADAGYVLSISNRTVEKAHRLIKELDLNAEVVDWDPQGAALIVNTTSAGLVGADLPVRWDRTEPDAVAYDLVYRTEPTPFLFAAANNNLKTVDGCRLLAAQGARSFEWWLGIPAPHEVMLRSLG
jgi:shikimate dehydrogenase